MSQKCGQKDRSKTQTNKHTHTHTLNGLGPREDFFLIFVAN